MIFIDTLEKTKINKEIVAYLIELKEQQFLLSETEEVCYARISLYNCIKYDLFIKSFLTHPLILVNKKFYEKKELIQENEIVSLIASVLEYEFTEKEPYLSNDEQNQLIKIHKVLNESNIEI